MPTNPCATDAFRGQSMSPNIVPFDRGGGNFLSVFYSNFVGVLTSEG